MLDDFKEGPMVTSCMTLATPLHLIHKPTTIESENRANKLRETLETCHKLYRRIRVILDGQNRASTLHVA